MKTFDVVIIGGGPGGINAGIMLSKGGKKVAMIQDGADSFGGTCLNRGCMPTKSLLKAATAYRYAKEAQKYGLDLHVGGVDLAKITAVTEADLNMLRGAINGMLAETGITTFRGTGSFESDHAIAITQADGSREVVKGETIIIATGSRPRQLPTAPFDARHVVSSDQMLTNRDLPKKLLIIGGARSDVSSQLCTTRSAARSYLSRRWSHSCHAKTARLEVENGLTLQQVANTVHAHPTHSKNILYAVQGCA